MQAVIMRGQELRLGEFPTPKPGPGEVVIKVAACGICGSDLHALKHGKEFIEQSQLGGTVGLDMDVERDVVMGHEYCGEIVEFGSGCVEELKLGQAVCSIPVLSREKRVHTIGYSNDHPGGYSEYMRLTESFLEPVPNGLSPTLAALTEPMAVGLHAVNKARLNPDDVPMVIGCGPVGLSVIAMLKRTNCRPILAADYSPARRKFAEIMGADIVINPADKSPYTSWREVASLPQDPTRQRPSWLGEKFRPAVIFECVGVPGVIDNIMKNSPHNARIVIVGVCMQADHYHPVYGINKELNLQFVVAYNRREFAQSLRTISEGEVDVQPLITKEIGLAEVASAFNELASPEAHAKIIVHPHH